MVKVGDNGNDKLAEAYGYNSTAEIDAQKGQAYGAIYGYACEHVMRVADTDPNYTKAPIALGTTGVPTISDAKVLLGNTSPKFILEAGTIA